MVTTCMGHCWQAEFTAFLGRFCRTSRQEEKQEHYD